MTLRVDGLTRLTTIDFPGPPGGCGVLPGLPLALRLLPQPGLLDASAGSAIAWESVLAFLHGRCGLLDGVVFSGGEPLAQSALPQALAQVRAMGFATALHTVRHVPSAVLPLLDWVNWTSTARRPATTPSRARRAAAPARLAALQLLLASGVDYECRTTWHEGLFDTPGLLGLAEQLARAGVVHWAPQECRTPDGPPTWGLTPAQQTLLQAQFPGFVLRSGL